MTYKGELACSPLFEKKKNKMKEKNTNTQKTHLNS